MTVNFLRRNAADYSINYESQSGGQDNSRTYRMRQLLELEYIMPAKTQTEVIQRDIPTAA